MLVAVAVVQQGVMVDWGQGSQTGVNLGLAASRIPIVAEALALRILESGLRPEEVDLVGHSLGSYVSVEAARILYRRYGFAVNSVTLLDPANVETVRYNPPSLSSLSPNTSTLSIYDLGMGGGNLANNGEYARSANRSIGLSGERGQVPGHAAPIVFYGGLLEINDSQTINDLRKGNQPIGQLFPNAQFIPGSPTRDHVQIYW